MQCLWGVQFYVGEGVVVGFAGEGVRVWCGVHGIPAPLTQLSTFVLPFPGEV